MKIENKGIILLALTLLFLSVTETSATEISVKPPSITVLINEQFKLSIDVKDVNNLIAYQVRLNWTPSLLGGFDVHEGTFLNSSGYSTSFAFELDELMDQNGTFIAYSIIPSASSPGASGSGTLFECSSNSTDSVGQSVMKLCDTRLFNASYTLVDTPPYLGDCTGPLGSPDMKVDARDFTLIAYCFLARAGSPHYNATADFNSDGVVDMYDLMCYNWNVGTTYGPGVKAKQPVEITHQLNDGEVQVSSGVHDVAVLNVKPSKTVVGEGYSLYVNVTVENQGDFAETFNVTVYANDAVIPTPEQWPNSTQMQTFWSLGDVNREGHIDDNDAILAQLAFNTVPGDQCWNPDADLDLSGKVDVLDAIKISNNYGSDVWSHFGLSGSLRNQTMVTLPAGGSASIVFTWDTTGFAKGDYAISAYAWPVQSELPIDTADNNCADGTVTVALVGDVSGDTLGVPDGKINMADVGVVARHFGAVVCHSPEGVWPYEPNYDVMGSIPPDFDLADYKINMADIGTVAFHRQ